ncbi:hypothetical protein N7532_011728 [Penicillium argentinense]|uniref:FAS1 domain-containing protein n=1 Tax=Penicillium argentinense TaxID=1131581 RepID=A0A9W9EJ57_9EURO|nr:uncharacterized protein N7532_011728 [Penicillium argentinense]KAJ5082685.1 hypothetical protein N7532_011728 [Penicillium argentinense]
MRFILLSAATSLCAAVIIPDQEVLADDASLLANNESGQDEDTEVDSWWLRMTELSQNSNQPATEVAMGLLGLDPIRNGFRDMARIPVMETQTEGLTEEVVRIHVKILVGVAVLLIVALAGAVALLNVASLDMVMVLAGEAVPLIAVLRAMAVVDQVMGVALAGEAVLLIAVLRAMTVVDQVMVMALAGEAVPLIAVLQAMTVVDQVMGVALAGEAVLQIAVLRAMTVVDQVMGVALAGEAVLQIAVLQAMAVVDQVMGVALAGEAVLLIAVLQAMAVVDQVMVMALAGEAVPLIVVLQDMVAVLDAVPVEVGLEKIPVTEVVQAEVDGPVVVNPAGQVLEEVVAVDLEEAEAVPVEVVDGPVVVEVALVEEVAAVLEEGEDLAGELDALVVGDLAEVVVVNLGVAEEAPAEEEEGVVVEVVLEEVAVLEAALEVVEDGLGAEDLEEAAVTLDGAVVFQDMVAVLGMEVQEGDVAAPKALDAVVIADEAMTAGLEMAELINESRKTFRLAELLKNHDDLVTLLNSSEGNYTLLAPTNSAIDRLLDRRHQPSFINELLQYHILPKRLDFRRVKNQQTLPTALNETSLGKNMPQRIVASRHQRQVVLNGASEVIAGDIIGSNGILHQINTPLIPPPNTSTILRLLPDHFSTFALGLEKAELAHHLTGDIKHSGTTFAPTNAAFNRLGPHANEYLFSEGGKKCLQALLRYHLVPDRTLYSDILYDQHGHMYEFGSGKRGASVHIKLTTLLKNRKLSVDVSWPGMSVVMRINGVDTIRVHDVLARDGVLHVLDQVLVPPKKLHVGEKDGLEEISMETLKDSFDECKGMPRAEL